MFTGGFMWWELDDVSARCAYALNFLLLLTCVYINTVSVDAVRTSLAAHRLKRTKLSEGLAVLLVGQAALPLIDVWREFHAC